MAVADIVDVYHGTCFEYLRMEEMILVPRNKANAIPTLDWKTEESWKARGCSVFSQVPTEFIPHTFCNGSTSYNL